MSLNAAFKLFLDEYPKAMKKGFAGNDVVEFVKNDVPNIIRDTIGSSERYKVHGSAGKGNWANSPWVAIFDVLVTDTAQDGFYLVYLVKEDFNGVYISLNQGITTVRAQYGVSAKKALRARSSDFVAKLGKLTEPYIIGPLDLEAKKSDSLSAFYEQGSICAKYYPKESIPEDKILQNDLNGFMHLYNVLVDKDSLIDPYPIYEEESGIEDLSSFKFHKRIERNKKVSNKAKKIHGYICQACGFNFEECYGEIGKGFIEAHHLVPLSKLKGQKITINARKDFAVLCSNCHRMIHKSESVSDVQKFRKDHLK
jgi:5-methylcytosine-specific restriction protein A